MLLLLPLIWLFWAEAGAFGGETGDGAGRTPLRAVLLNLLLPNVFTRYDCCRLYPSRITPVFWRTA